MTTSATLQALAAAPTPDARLRALKDLKNSVIGNTWKKVEHAGDDALLRLYVTLFGHSRTIQLIQVVFWISSLFLQMETLSAPT